MQTMRRAPQHNTRGSETRPLDGNKPASFCSSNHTNTPMKFNFLKSQRPRGLTTNLAGGEAFVETPKLELATLLLTSTLGDQFYRSANAAATSCCSPGIISAAPVSITACA